MIDSSIVTIMQFRRGGIPSLSNDDFAKYRASIDHVSEESKVTSF